MAPNATRCTLIGLVYLGNPIGELWDMEELSEAVRCRRPLYILFTLRPVEVAARSRLAAPKAAAIR
jgi:hypothetical protein